MSVLYVFPYYVYVRIICMPVLIYVRSNYGRTMCMSVLYLRPYYVYARTICMSVLCVCLYYVYVRTNLCPY